VLDSKAPGGTMTTTATSVQTTTPVAVRVARATPQSTIRLLIVDAHPLMRCALAHIATEAPGVETVGQASTADEAVALAATSRPDVVTIDCSLTEGAGWQLARDLRDRYPRLGIVLLTGLGADDSLFRALDSGASACLGQSASVAEVLSAIRHCAVAPSFFSASGMAQALRRRQDVNARQGEGNLSEREHQVIRLLREGLTVSQVAGELHVSLSTAKTYVARVYEKLGANNRAQALMTAVRLGIFG
jgi:DNA-binding NarL/FixJ family response regulator